jgi:hypothetical protein
MFDGSELEKSSTHITLASFKRRSHKCEPINPAPPVTKTFFFSNIGESIRFFYDKQLSKNVIILAKMPASGK